MLEYEIRNIGGGVVALALCVPSQTILPALDAHVTRYQNKCTQTQQQLILMQLIS